jgi:transposase
MLNVTFNHFISMTYRYCIGIDISKHTLDYCIVQDKIPLASGRVGNHEQGLQKLVSSLEAKKIPIEEALFCAESTGIYSACLLAWIGKRGYAVWIENPLAIKRSMGLQRGKSDAVDARRIALYGYTHQDRARLWQPRKHALEQLERLAAQRRRLLTAINQLKKPLQESKIFLSDQDYKMLETSCAAALEGLRSSLQQVDKQLQELVQADEELTLLYHRVTSVSGIGAVTAMQLIIATNEFKKIPTARKLACYAGVAPFAYSSGTSVRAPARVSHLAAKGLKSLLHMAALSAVRNSEELKAYYDRKVAEGKNKMLVINAVRSKLIARVYACVRDSREYEEHYQGKMAA